MMKNNKITETTLFVLLVLIFSIIAVISLTRSIKSIKNEESQVSQITHDTILYKDPEFIRLVDTVIVTQDKIREKLLYQVPVETRDSIVYMLRQIDNLNKKLILVQSDKSVRLRDTVYVPFPYDRAKLESQVKKERSFLNDFHTIHLNEINIHTIKVPRYGLGLQMGFGGTYGFDDNRLHYGPYLGVGAYYRF